MYSQVKEAAEKEWEAFHAERAAGIDEIKQLRHRAAEEEERKKRDRPVADVGPEDQDSKMEEDGKEPPTSNGAGSKARQPQSTDIESKKPAASPHEHTAQMDVDDEGGTPTPSAANKLQTQAQSGAGEKAQPAPMVQASSADEDDAVEY